MAGLHLAVRTVHLLGMVALVSGAVVVWGALRRGVADPRTLTAGYEWLFWGALGVMVVTGVGNLGALGGPGPATRWGRVFAVKLVVVLALVVGSFVRTMAVVTLRDREREPTGLLRRAYGSTAALLLVLVVLAEVLAHG